MPQTDTAAPRTEDQDLANEIYRVTDQLNLLMRRASGTGLEVNVDVNTMTSLGYLEYPQLRTRVSRPFDRTDK